MPCSRMKRLWPWFAALLSGILLALCYAPAGWSGLAWVALTPLLAALWFSEPWTRREGGRLFLLGYVTGVGYFLGCFHWLVTVTVPGWIALCLYLAVYPAAWAVFVGAWKPRQSPFEAKPVWMKSGNNLLVAALAAAAWIYQVTTPALADGLAIHPARLHGATFHTYDDHRLATAAAVLGLVVPGVLVENVATTSKTLPDFVDLWRHTLEGS